MLISFEVVFGGICDSMFLISVETENKLLNSLRRKPIIATIDRLNARTYRLTNKCHINYEAAKVQHYFWGFAAFFKFRTEMSKAIWAVVVAVLLTSDAHIHRNRTHMHTHTPTTVNHISQRSRTGKYSTIKSHCAWLFCIRTHSKANTHRHQCLNV